MKNIALKYMIAAAFITGLCGLSSCEKNFGSINTDPSVVTTPDVKFLLSYSEDRLITYQGGEWVWEAMEQLWRFTQHVTSDPYELSSNVNARYNAYYQQILPNLFEIRKQIAQKPDKDSYQKMGAITYIIQVLQGIKVTDMNGSIPYAQAEQGRYAGDYSPTYDTQPVLFDTWLHQLDSTITILENNSLPNQQSYGAADIFYHSDWTKWVMLANTIKLRIAARLENQDKSKTQSIFQEVMQDPIGPISNDDAQLSYSSDFLPFGTSGDIDYRSPRYASASIMKFMKASDDPRLPIYFEKNGLQGDFKDTLSKYHMTLPSFMDINDPLVMYQGGPADWTIDPTYASYIKNPVTVGTNRYFLISHINRKFFSPRYNGNTSGVFTEIMVTNAESCLLVAEFIEKGYAGGVDTHGSAEDWYNKGITSSIKTMNSIAVAAASTTAYTGDGTAMIDAYLADPEVKFNGVNDLERIYIQQYLNLYRNPIEAFVFCRRTGYPKYGSAYYPREPFHETIPRRWWTIDPGEVNRAHWNDALNEEGFTPNAQDVPTLNKERVWYDKTAPDFGGGK